MRAWLRIILLLAPACGGGDLPEPPELPAGAPVDAEVAAEIEAAVAAVRADPGSAEARFALAARYDANGLPHLARSAYAQVLLVDGGNVKATYHLARNLVELGEDDEAKSLFASVVAEAPDYAPARRRLGFLLLDAGDLDGAHDAFVRAAELDPSDPGAPLGLARVELERGRAAEAIARITPVLETHPKHGYATHLLASALRLAGEPEAAEDTAKRADGRRPVWDDPWEREVRALQGGPRVRLADARRKLEREGPAAALRDLEALHAARPDDVGVLGSLAGAYCALGRSDDALRVLDAARKRMPKHNRIPLIAGEVHASRGDFPAAVRETERAVSLQPDFALAHFRLGLLRAELGDDAGALAALEEAARLGDADAGAMLARMRGEDE